jgi:hypothetical protein
MQTCFLLIYIFLWMEGVYFRKQILFCRGKRAAPYWCCYCTIEEVAILPFLLESNHKTFIGIHINLLQLTQHYFMLVFFIYNLLLYYFFLSFALPYYTRDPTHWINQKMNWINHKVDCRKQMNYLISILIFY